VTDDGVHFFPDPARWRRWLEEHHERADELWVGFRKRSTGLPSITWPESVDEALSFGWIDGVRKRIDDASYKIRFTPRRRGSIWSAVNVRRIEELIELGRVRPAGLRAFEARQADRTAIYVYERAPAELPPEFELRLRADEAAWRFFQSRPPSYRRTVVGWVVAAKQEATRERRLARLIEDSREGRLSGTFRPAGGG
jgi:uncharacterized protein YdeI (YjbR/CyaY-like superfamily)